MVIDNKLIERGHPSEHVADCIEPHDLFSSFLPDDFISIHIVDKTNVKMVELHSNIGEGKRGSST